MEGADDKGDQYYINTKLKQRRFKNLRIKMLDRDIFPNGWWWQKNSESIDPYIVHYNCIDGGIKAKENCIKKYNHWIV